MGKTEIPYWLCCGAKDQEHKKEKEGRCLERAMGYPEHCRFGTITEHKAGLNHGIQTPN